MRDSCNEKRTPSTKNGGRACPSAKSADKIVQRKFGAVAKVLWDKPDTAIATIAKCDPRTGRRILRGDAPVPAEVLAEAINEMLRPLD